MLRSDQSAVRAAGIDAVALKPAECDVRAAREVPVDTVVFDFEGREHVPDSAFLADLAGEKTVRVTTPVRADGFDRLGDDSLERALPEAVGRVLVAGNPAYLDEAEAERAVAERLGAAADAHPDAWVGTEGVERLALATGNAQFALLSRSTEREVRALRAAGFDGEFVLYAPTVLSGDEDEVLDAVGAYAARRGPVKRALPEGAATDGTASGRAREVLTAAVRDYALAGAPGEVRARVDALRDAGVDTVVGYPAAGVESFTR